MTYTALSAVGGMMPPTVVAVVLLYAWLRRQTGQARPQRRPQRRPRLRPWLYLALVLIPLRLIAGRRPLLARPQRPWLTAKQVAALELQLGLREPENVLEQFDDPALDSYTGHSGGVMAAIPPLIDPERFVAQFADPRVLGEVDVSNDPDPVVRSLRNRRYRAWAKAKLLADHAARGNRTFTCEEMAIWDAMNAEMDHLDRRIKAILDVRDRVTGFQASVHACIPSCTDPTHTFDFRYFGDPHSVTIAAVPEHQKMLDYERGRDAGEDIVRRIERGSR